MTSSPRCLIDTNIVIYARSAGSAKSEVARRIMTASRAACTGVLSTQVLIETFEVLARTSPTPQGRAKAVEHVSRLAIAFPILPAHAQTVLHAADCSHRHGLRIFDAMIWAAAMLEGVPFVLSEDFGHRSTIGEVTFLNPFAEDFDPADLTH